MSLSFAPASRRSAARYTAVSGDRRYLVEYRPRLASWVASVSHAQGTNELGRADNRHDAQKIAQSHARGRK